MTPAQAKVCEIAANVFNVPSVNQDDSADTIVTWDSVTQLNLILAIEEEFGVEFEPEEMDSLASIRLLCDAVERRTAKNAS